jgi:hypothetical protein
MSNPNNVRDFIIGVVVGGAIVGVGWLFGVGATVLLLS